MKKTLALVICIPLMFFSGCATRDDKSISEQQPIQNQQKKEIVMEPEVPPVKQGETTTDIAEKDTIIAEFDSIKITKETFDHTKTEMQLVVEDLNKITYSRDYKRWLEYLSDEYVSTFSDPENLKRVSTSLPTKGIQLKDLKDYFVYVFVPSRQNMRVDDIKFVSPTRVYVIMELSPQSPAAIYILERAKDGWKLVPKNQ
jgi:hypothetical protein